MKKENLGYLRRQKTHWVLVTMKKPFKSPDVIKDVVHVCVSIYKVGKLLNAQRMVL
jgi:hypothetical protein